MLDEPAARAAGRGRLRARAGGLGGRARRRRGRPRRRVRARAARARSLGAHDTLRSRGDGASAAADPAAGGGARPRAAGRRRASRGAPRWRAATARGRARARAALRGVRAAARGLGVPWPGALDAAKLTRRREGARRPTRARPTARRGRRTAAPAPTTTRAPRSILLDDLLDRFGARLRRGEGGARGRRLRRPRAARPRPARRPGDARALGRALRADHGRRVPGHERGSSSSSWRRSSATTCSRSATSSSRSTASATPTSRIFRERASALGARRVRRLAVNFRSREELLDVLNGAFAPELGERFTPLRGRARRVVPDGRAAAVRPRSADRRRRPSSCWSPTNAAGTTSSSARLGLAGGRRRSRGGAPRRGWSPTGCARRSTRAAAPATSSCSCARPASLRLLEQALEEQGLPTYVVGGRGYWSQEQVRDGARLAARARQPARRGGAARRARLAVLRRRDRRAGAARRRRPGARRACGRRCARSRAPSGRPCCPRPSARGWSASRDFFAAERAQAERLPAEVLLERAIVATGYDLAVLARPGGDRRLANLRKLMRLAREYERAEGRDLRGFLAVRRHAGPAPRRARARRRSSPKGSTPCG